jgi:hypothetical protein
MVELVTPSAAATEPGAHNSFCLPLCYSSTL